MPRSATWIIRAFAPLSLAKAFVVPGTPRATTTAMAIQKMDKPIILFIFSPCCQSLLAYRGLLTPISGGWQAQLYPANPPVAWGFHANTLRCIGYGLLS
jgi:hypothetical protein